MGSWSAMVPRRAFFFQKKKKRAQETSASSLSRSRLVRPQTSFFPGPLGGDQLALWQSLTSIRRGRPEFEQGVWIAVLSIEMQLGPFVRAVRPWV